MTTFSDAGIDLFEPYQNIVPLKRKRSDGRLKSPLSATDLRSWANDEGQRRRHMLDVINTAVRFNGSLDHHYSAKDD